MGLSFRCPRSRLLKLLLFQSGLFLSIALYLYCSNTTTTTTTTMGEPFPEIKSTHSLVAKYVTKPLWDKLSSVKTATSSFTLAKVGKGIVGEETKLKLKCCQEIHPQPRFLHFIP